MSDFTRVQQQKQAVKDLNEVLQNNQHTLVAMTSEEFVDFVISQKMAAGMTIEQTTAWLDGLIVASSSIPAQVKQTWAANKNSIKNKGAYLPVLSDGKTLAVLAYDLKKSGNMFSKYRISTLLKESESRMKENYRNMKNEIKKGLNYADEDPVGFMHRLFGVPYFDRSFRR